MSEPFTVEDVERAADWCAVGDTPEDYHGAVPRQIAPMLRALAERMRVEQAATHRRCGSCGRQDVLPIAASWTNCPCGSSWFIIGEPPHDPDALTGEYRTAGTTNVTIPLGPPYGASSTPDVLAARDAEIAAVLTDSTIDHVFDVAWDDQDNGYGNDALRTEFIKILGPLLATRDAEIAALRAELAYALTWLAPDQLKRYDRVKAELAPPTTERQP